MEKKSRISAQVIGANIRRIRLEHGETQQHLGTLLGYGATTIANYESGYRMPDLESFFQIALHYGASLEDFIQEINSIDSMDSIDSIDAIDSIDSINPLDSIDSIDSTEPLGSIDSIDSTDSTDSVDTIDSTDSSTDSKDLGGVHES